MQHAHLSVLLVYRCCFVLFPEQCLISGNNPVILLRTSALLLLLVVVVYLPGLGAYLLCQHCALSHVVWHANFIFINVDSMQILSGSLPS